MEIFKIYLILLSVMQQILFNMWTKLSEHQIFEINLYCSKCSYQLYCYLSFDIGSSHSEKIMSN